MTMGIDVSAKKLAVCWRGDNGQAHVDEVTNDKSGHMRIIRIATAAKRTNTTVGLEATSLYHLDLALALRAAGVAVMIINPLAARRFAQAKLKRAKTDRVDAAVLLDFVERMPFRAWEPPSANRLAVKALARELEALAAERTRHLNRQHHEAATNTTTPFLAAHREALIAMIDKQVAVLLAEALRIIRSDAELAQMLDAILSVPGFGEKSAVALIGEFAVLDGDMTPAQLVAHAGLDPRPRESGTLTGRVAISKIGNAHLRRALYMPALTGGTREPTMKAFKERLVARGKKPLVAVVALMRRLLICTWTLARKNQRFDPAKFASSTRAA